MGILGIENRTENWKTARYFAPFFKSNSARAKLARRLGEPTEPRGEIRIELFWRGIREYIRKERLRPEDRFEHFRTVYSQEFCELRKKIEEFSGFKQLKDWNYNGSKKYPTKRYGDKLSSNLLHTEIDIVFETPKRLFIGEAKGESSLGANAEYVLVHQLIRQYVMAKVLIGLKCESKEVIPFIVENKAENKPTGMKDTVQVKFMLDQGWLEESNIQTWDCIRDLWRPEYA